MESFCNEEWHAGKGDSQVIYFKWFLISFFSTAFAMITIWAIDEFFL